ncbi:ligase-associated DNA damage response DEXH box helicase [Polluticoccus soli]|uniref:ligase-associated DNA damage response DEXH box helicase n=1 Tax=Polluticoccus soli TaxID=3034150 RepID=UPI0023E2EA67|nr:ligase-associated DNA damage response DEXH box helicase [Flavipsychrobacter sp. JY13-12]
MAKKKQQEQLDGFEVIRQWLGSKGLKPFAFQEEAWQMYVEGLSGIVNAPTGFGKTFSIFLGVLIDWINRNPDYHTKTKNGLQLLWITPLRALAKDIGRAMEIALGELQIPWKVGVRNGDTPVSVRQQQKTSMPEILIITPESLHLLLASKNYKQLFKGLHCIAVDEWHELLGSKRGVQVELALSHIKTLYGEGEHLLRIWGISATIGNLDEAMTVLLGADHNGIIVRSNMQKNIAINTLLPETVERFPWAGHLGLKMIDKVLPIIHQSRSTLLFTNVRSQAEIWYQALLDAAPDLAGAMALHHSAIESELRMWVEEQLHLGTLKVVVCTASLDLGVDFRPVDTVIQIGSPKGIARFMQRAGRSGHEPGAVSNIYFVPTHSLEIVEGAALQQAYIEQRIESRVPVVMAFDVLIQYMVSRAVGEGFTSEELYNEVITTHCFADLNREEWEWMLAFITTGGSTLNNYDEYHKVVNIDGVYRVINRRVAMRHRMHIGTIVGDALMRVKFLGGGFVGTIEESFISRLNPGDVFVLAGRKLELIMVKDMNAIVKRSNAKNALVPSWQGGRLPLSANLGEVLRATFQRAALQPETHPLLQFLAPLFDKQKAVSYIPKENELLVELIDTRDGYHLFVYPFEGRLVHQSMASMLAYRIAQLTPITFSIAMNDYGFELLSDQPLPVNEDNIKTLFDPANWYTDLQRSVNAAELGKRKFRDIAVIAGLIFQGYPGAQKKQRHLQNSTSLIYNVLIEHEPTHLLLQQAYNEALAQEMEAERLYNSLERIYTGNIVISRPADLTPFCFPIKVDSLREELTSEKLADRIRRMQQQLDK